MAEEAGVSGSALRRARQSLGVRHRREGFGADGVGAACSSRSRGTEPRPEVPLLAMSDPSREGGEYGEHGDGARQQGGHERLRYVIRLVLCMREAQAHGPDGGAVLFELVLEMEARVHALLEWQQGRLRLAMGGDLRLTPECTASLESS